METPTPSIKSHIFQYGILLGIISVVFSLMIFFLDMHYSQESSLLYVSFIISIGVIVLAQYNFRKENQGFISFGEAFKLGLGVALLSGIIGVIYQFLLVTVIDPETITKMMEINRNNIIDQSPEISQEQLDQIIDMQKKFTTPKMMVVFGLAFSLIFGSIISLITGLILKRNRPE